MQDEAKDAQQEPQQDSGLQTPQPDQPMPKESERRDDVAEDSEQREVRVETDGPAEVNVDVPAAPAE